MGSAPPDELGNRRDSIKKVRLENQSDSGAGDEARTRYLHLGKVALYRMSYTRETLSIIARFSDLSRNFFAHSAFCYRLSLE